MPIVFHALSSQSISGGLRCARPQQDLPEHVLPTNPAMDVMTDLKRISAITVSPGESIDNALNIMINKGIRLLLVEDHEVDVVGLVTATDIQGEKPMKLVQENGVHHDEITVADIMTPIRNFDVLDIDAVRRSHVGDIVRTLTGSGRQHALVVETQGHETVIRGIFSTTQISRQLGMPIRTSEKAQTFAELEMAIAS